MNTTPAGKPRRHQDCPFGSFEEYYMRLLKDLSDKVEENQRTSVQLFSTAITKVEVVGNAVEAMDEKLDTHLKALRREGIERELDQRKWLEERLGRLESRDTMQEQRIADLAKAGATGTSVRVSSAVSGIVIGLGLAVYQLVQWLQ